MIIIKVELHSVITGKLTELARMHIINRGDGTAGVGNYITRTLRGRCSSDLDKGRVQRNGSVVNHRRLNLHVWHLVSKALIDMGYGATINIEDNSDG